MNRENLKCWQVAPGGLEKPGDFCFADDLETLFLWLPGSFKPDVIPITRQPLCSQSWLWDGNLESPSLLQVIESPGRWRGLLRAGKLLSC